MAVWTATIISSDPISPVDIVEMSSVAVKFDSDDNRTTTRSYRISTQAQLVNAIRNQLATFNGFDLDKLALGPIDVSKPAPPDPTDIQLAAQAYTQKRSILIQTKQDFDLGLADQSALDAALTDAKAAQSAIAAATTPPIIVPAPVV